jgi:hypothetical protein
MKFIIGLIGILIILISSVIYIFFTKDSVESVKHKNHIEQKDINLTELNNPIELEDKAQQEYYDSISEDIKAELENAREVYISIDKAPTSGLFGSKDSFDDDLNAIFDDILSSLDDNRLEDFRDNIESAKENIKNLYIEINQYIKEQKTAPKESYIETTIDEYTQKIKDLEQEVKLSLDDINNNKQNIKNYLFVLGIRVNNKKMNMLLSRVDKADIVKMALMMNMLKREAKALRQEIYSSELTLDDTKKYYDISRILFKFVIYQQNIYNQHLDNYIEFLDNNVEDNEVVYKRSIKEMKLEKDKLRLKIYKKNIKILTTFRRASLRYKKDLLKQKKRLRQIKYISLRNLKVLQNSFDVSSHSLESIKPIVNIEKEFDKIIKRYMIIIEKFKSNEVKRKYIELTYQMLNK